MQQSNPLCLDFDEKVIEWNEHLVICVGSTEFSNNIGVKILNDKKAATIAKAIGDCLESFNLWYKMGMIVSDNEATNTGRKGGEFCNRNILLPPFYGCQMYKLDFVFKDGQITVF